MKTNEIKLPLAHSSHCQIVDAADNLALQVCSGGIGIEAAGQLQDLVVIACNSHAKLLKALRDIAEDASAAGAGGDAEAYLVALGDIERAARAGLTAAGAA